MSIPGQLVTPITGQSDGPLARADLGIEQAGLARAAFLVMDVQAEAWLRQWV